jgi:hypothetical protein
MSHYQNRRAATSCLSNRPAAAAATFAIPVEVQLSSDFDNDVMRGCDVTRG